MPMVGFEPTIGIKFVENNRRLGSRGRCDKQVHSPVVGYYQ
jgi:hypothetical protein